MSPLAEMRVSANARDFVDDDALTEKLRPAPPDPVRVREIVAKSLEKQPLTVDETAALLAAEDPELREEIFDGARRLKRRVYGNRIVLFAPLYIGNDCVNDCVYCAFKRSNLDVVRRTLSDEDIQREVEALQRMGHRRLIVVFGEHPRYDAEFIAHCVRRVYRVHAGRGDIRRVNVNAAPLSHEGFRVVKEARIGVYQVFQETYHHETYARLHGADTRKSDYLWRLDGLSRAVEAGIGDVGIGALFGLYDWRFEVLALVSHARYLQERHGAGPHTISFPRLQPAAGVRLESNYLVSDADFKRLVAILRLAAPYAGLVCTARESAQVRRDVLAFGVSQIDAGTRIELGGYTEVGDAQVIEREQFQIGDLRPLDAVVHELLTEGYIPSFCTSCYRLGRTGERVMDFSMPGAIQRFCTPNALVTLQEYLIDYASPEARAEGERLIAAELAKMSDDGVKQRLVERLGRIHAGERDLFI